MLHNMKRLQIGLGEELDVYSTSMIKTSHLNCPGFIEDSLPRNKIISPVKSED